MNRRGGALIATIIISMLLLSLSVWYFNWSWTQSQQNTYEQVSQRAMEYAESGIQAAQEQLMMPSTGDEINLAKGSGEMDRGRYEFELTQDSQTPSQVMVRSTGYCVFPHGSMEDPVTHQRVQMAVIQAAYDIDRMDQIMIAVPGKLNVNPGTVADGLIYADDIVFVRGLDDNPAQLASVAYSHTMSRDDGVIDSSPSHVRFASVPLRVGYPLRIPQLSTAIRNYYEALATSRISQLDDGSSLNGSVDAPQGSPVPVYFCNGDLHIGGTDLFTPKSAMVIYVTGLLHIHNSVMAGGGWVIFLAERGIQIEDDAPNDLTLQATFVTNGTIAAGPRRRAGKLLVHGSLLAGQGIDLAASWNGRRAYIQHDVSANLPLPRIVERMESKVVQGKYR